MQTFLPVDSVCITGLSYNFEFNFQFICTSVFFKKSIKRAKIHRIKIRPQNIPTMQFDRHTPQSSLTRNLKVANKDLRHLIGY